MRNYLFPFLIGFVGLAILLKLGFWQVARLEWKEGILAEIDAKIAAEPVALPTDPNPQRDNRLSVRLKAQTTGEEAHVIFSQPFAGPGYLVIVPAVLEDGREVLIDLGYVREINKDNPRPAAQIEVIGNLLWPNETDGFTPEPNFERNIWFARNSELMAAHFGTEPLMVIAREVNGMDATTPIAIGHNIPNDHLEYALTWFSLALVWLGMTLFWVSRIRAKHR